MVRLMMTCVGACNMINVQAHGLWAGHRTRCLQVTGPTLPRNHLASFASVEQLNAKNVGILVAKHGPSKTHNHNF